MCHNIIVRGIQMCNSKRWLYHYLTACNTFLSLMAILSGMPSEKFVLRNKSYANFQPSFQMIAKASNPELGTFVCGSVSMQIQEYLTIGHTQFQLSCLSNGFLLLLLLANLLPLPGYGSHQHLCHLDAEIWCFAICPFAFFLYG